MNSVTEEGSVEQEHLPGPLCGPRLWSLSQTPTLWCASARQSCVLRAVCLPAAAVMAWQAAYVYCTAVQDEMEVEERGCEHSTAESKSSPGASSDDVARGEATDGATDSQGVGEGSGSVAPAPTPTSAPRVCISPGSVLRDCTGLSARRMLAVECSGWCIALTSSRCTST